MTNPASKQKFTNNKTGKTVQIHWHNYEERIARGFVMYHGVKENGDKTGPLLTKSVADFLKAYTAK